MKKDIFNCGALVVPFGENPFSGDDWDLLEILFKRDRLPHDIIDYGDTGETLNGSFSRIKKQNDDTYACPEIKSLFLSDKFLNFLRKITEIESLHIDRLQGHYYEKGGFIALHNDKESCNHYLYSVILMLTDDYKGGEFVIHHPEKGQLPFRAPRRSVLFTPCCYSHEVKPVLSGIRHGICLFVMDNSASLSPAVGV